MWLNDTGRLPLIRKKGGCWTSCCHAASPLVGFNPYFTKLQRFPVWVGNHKYPLTVSAGLWFWVTLMVSVNAVFVRLISWNLCVHTRWHSPPPPCFVSCAAADIISTVEFNSSGELLATGDKGGRVVVFQREQEVGNTNNATLNVLLLKGSIFKIFFLYCIKNTISLPNAI